MKFVVCASCSRHVRVGEASCPFCAAALSAELVPVPHGPRRSYIGKNATALAIAALAVGGCSSEDTVVGQPADVGVDTSQIDSAAADTRTDDTRVDDTHVDDTFASDVQDDGGAVPLYK